MRFVLHLTTKETEAENQNTRIILYMYEVLQLCKKKLSPLIRIQIKMMKCLRYRKVDIEAVSRLIINRVPVVIENELFTREIFKNLFSVKKGMIIVFDNSGVASNKNEKYYCCYRYVTN